MRVTPTVLAMSLAALAPVRADDPKPAPPGAGRPAPPGRASPDAAALAGWLEKAYDGTRPPEAVRMLAAIARGSGMGAGEGWFGPAETRYTWEWLARRHGLDPARAAVPKDRFRGPAELFARLDRNKDGRILPEDLDWSDRSPYVQMASVINRIYRRVDVQGAGKLTREQWMTFFDRATDGKDYLTADDLRDALLAGFSSTFLPGDSPDPAVLV